MHGDTDLETERPTPRPPADAADPLAALLRGFGPVGILAILVIVAANAIIKPLGALLVLLWAKRSGTSWDAIGFVRPRRWGITIVAGLGLGIALKLLMKALIMPLLGAPPVNQAYHFLVGNTAALPWMLYAILAGAAFGEEMLFRGFAFERLRALVGESRAAQVLILTITSVVFGLAHYSDQGLAGAQQATMMGAVYGTMYLATRSLALPMIAHAAFNLTALAIIYWDLETQIARLILR